MGEQERFVKKLVDLTFSLDSDQDNRITREEFERSADHAELVEAFGGLRLPSEFNLHELHQMLDVDGNGWVSRKEFLSGMKRLLYSNSFQRDCLFMLNMGQIKTQVFLQMEKMKKELR